MYGVCIVRVIVTGASGFVGFRLVKELLRRGVETCAVSRQPVQFIDSLVVDSYLDTPTGDVLIHLAENANRAQVNEIGSAYFDEAVKLANTLALRGYQRIVFASSAAVYGDRDKRQHKPSDPVLVTDIYSQTKLECEKQFSEENGVIARISNLYGFGMSKDNVISRIIKQVRGDGEVKVRDDKVVRDFLWIDDAVDALVEMALGRSRGTYNIASGRSISVGDLIDAALLASGSNKRYIRAPTNPVDTHSAVHLDISDTSEAFGWVPKLKLEHGLKQLLGEKTSTQ